MKKLLVAMLVTVASSGIAAAADLGVYTKAPSRPSNLRLDRPLRRRSYRWRVVNHGCWRFIFVTNSCKLLHLRLSQLGSCHTINP